MTEGKSEFGSGSGDSIFGDDDEPHPALFDYDVMEHIFSFIRSTKELKNYRLVSKLWDEAAVSNLGKISSFPIRKLQLGVPVHPRLLRNIEIDFIEGNGQRPRPWPRVEDYLPFLHIHRREIEGIVFNHCNLEKEDNSRTFFPKISTVLQDIPFRFLKKLSLNELMSSSVDHDIDTALGHAVWNPNLRLIMNRNLENIKILEFSTAHHGPGYTNIKNQPTFQLLIDKCPNLEELRMRGNFYLDLSTATKLKSLVWEGPRVVLCDHGHEIIFQTTDFSLSNLVKMLEGVGSWLENLVLGSSQEAEADKRFAHCVVDGEVERERVKDARYELELYPAMPKLVKLLVSDVTIFAISPQSFTKDRCPALKNLTLRSTQKYEYPIKAFLTAWASRKNCVVNSEYLSINQCPSGVSDIWRDVAATFPNLKKLSLGLSRVDNPKLVQYHDRVGPLTKNTLNLIACFLPNLEELRIHVKFPCTLQELMDAIWAKGFAGKDLKKITLVATKGVQNVHGWKEDCCDNFRVPFMLYKNLTLEGFKIAQKTRMRMMNYIAKRKLKVNLF